MSTQSASTQPTAHSAGANANDDSGEERAYDVITVGAGIGGLYATYRFTRQGLSTLCLEGAAGVGGVWYHNRYPGARVDIDSIDYCYYFSPELYQEWRWTERYATQPELLKYLNHVADRFDLRRHILLNTWMRGAQWREDTRRYHIQTSTGRRFSCRFLVMTTGQLSEARDPQFPGLADFKGEWVQASHWPEREVRIAGRRVAVIGTGSSGVQTVAAISPLAGHVYVFQRSPNYVVPARNGPQNEAMWEQIRANVRGEREFILGTPGANHRGKGSVPAAQYSPEEQAARLEAQWQRGGQGMNSVFGDQATNKESNDLVANFVRAKIREIVKDPATAEKLCPYDHPIGTRRLVLEDGYYQSFNRDSVTLVDVREAPIERITATGVQTSKAHYEVDLIIFALGFHAFTGALREANIRNARGRSPVEHWRRGPRTLLGIMTTEFPNLFIVTGPGSSSVLANMTLGNEFHIDWIADCIAHMQRHGYGVVEATETGETAWTEHVADAASKILRRNVRNYMVHVNEDDGSRVFMPYVGGMDRYVKAVREATADNYRGFSFR